jgi:hypothetical protein
MPSASATFQSAQKRTNKVGIAVQRLWKVGIAVRRFLMTDHDVFLKEKDGLRNQEGNGKWRDHETATILKMGIWGSVFFSAPFID